MGGSGAGKTTLMDVIAGRKTQGEITGDILVNGHPKDQATWSRVMGYVEQVLSAECASAKMALAGRRVIVRRLPPHRTATLCRHGNTSELGTRCSRLVVAVRQTDIHSPTVTVYESLIFSARLRLPVGLDDEKACPVLDMSNFSAKTHHGLVSGNRETCPEPLSVARPCTVPVCPVVHEVVSCRAGLFRMSDPFVEVGKNCFNSVELYEQSSYFHINKTTRLTRMK